MVRSRRRILTFYHLKYYNEVATMNKSMNFELFDGEDFGESMKKGVRKSLSSHSRYN